MKKFLQSKFFVFIKKHKWWFLFAILTLISLLIVSLQGKDKTPAKVRETPTPNPERSLPLEIPTTKNKEQSYFINQVTTNVGPVTGYSWSKNLLYYSNPNGIYKAGTNEVVVEMPIQKINWANNGNAVFESGGLWFKTDINNKYTKLNKLFVNPVINNSGSLIADFTQNKLQLYNTIDSSKKVYEFNETIKNSMFTDNPEKIIVSTEFGGKTTVFRLDTDLKVELEREFPSGYILSSVSPDGNSLAMSTQGTLLITTFTNDIKKVDFPTKSRIFSAFRNLNEIVIVEQYKDSLGRTLENIHKSNLAGQIFRVSDSKAMKNRINTSVPIMFNSDRSIATFSENKGNTWILSLIPNLFPTYSTSGELVFSKIKPYTH